MRFNGRGNRKGFFFTLLVVVLFSLVMLSMRAWTREEQAAGGLEAIRVRADALGSLADSAAGDANRMIGIAGDRAVYYSAFYAAYTRTALTNVSVNISEVLVNNTMNGAGCYGVPVGTCAPGSAVCCFADQTENASFKLWGEGFAEKAAGQNALASYNFAGGSVSQSSPFGVRVSLTARVSLNDSSRVATFQRTSSLSRLVNISGFEDPAYAINSSGTMRRNVTLYPDGHSLVSLNATCNYGGNGWAYGEVLNLDGYDCTYLANLPESDKNKTLVVNDITTAAGTCKDTVNAFRGIIFNTNASNPGAIANLTVPYGYNSTGNDFRSRLPNGTRVLINNDGTRHEITNLENLRALTYNGSYYRESPGGPDYLGRLAYNFTFATHGIESLVNYSIATADANTSWVDYYYFSGRNCSTTGCWKVKGTLNCEDAAVCANAGLVHFLIDNNSVFLNGTPGHLEYYQVENITLPN